MQSALVTRHVKMELAFNVLETVFIVIADVMSNVANFVFKPKGYALAAWCLVSVTVL